MSMFCFQCQEAAKGTGCTNKGVCGKSSETAGQQDLLLFALRGIALAHQKANELGVDHDIPAELVVEGLFTTVTNVSFDEQKISDQAAAAFAARDAIRTAVETEKGKQNWDQSADALSWAADRSEFAAKAATVGVMATADEDLRSLRELLIYGLKGVAAYAHHAHVLGYDDDSITEFLLTGLAATAQDKTVDEMIALCMKTGEIAVTTMALLDKANTETYGNPELTKVSLGVGSNPGILISGHDLKDLEELLEQTADTGVDVYTHGEMLPAHYYPFFKKYDNLVGNYGGAWFDQRKEFASFNGPILMTTNCLVPVSDAYRDRLFTTSVVAYPEITHIADRPDGGKKDFSAIIEKAKTCQAPTELETGNIVGGFAHNQVLALADKVVDAVKSGAIKRFIVMAGCDGRQKERGYFSDVASTLPDDAVILTAGCAKYRYNKLDLGDIGGIPRVLDAGQCNDSYSLAVIAMKLQEVFELDDINDLPISFDIAWYEQKAVTVLLALLFLGVKSIRLGPTLPAFLSPNVAKVLVENFDIKGIASADEDVRDMMAGG